MPFDLVLRGGRVIDPSQKLDAVTDVGFAAGKVVMIGNELKADPRNDVRDVSGYVVTPGLIDCTPTSIGAAPRSASTPRSSVAPPASPRRSTPAAPARAILPASAST
jgi:predicted amidohydrolase